MLTKKEVKIYRLCHHSFAGHTTVEAAGILGKSPRRIEQILAGIMAKAPQLFPILTKLQARDYHLFMDEGWTMQEIADDTGRSQSTVNDSIQAAVAKGMSPKGKRKRVLRYQPWMDNEIKEVY